MTTMRSSLEEELTVPGSVSRQAGHRIGREVATYMIVGVMFGVVLVKAEIVSWYRIQEMFRFQSFHMYGILGSAFAVAGVSVALLKRYHVPTIDGQPIVVPPKIKIGRAHV